MVDSIDYLTSRKERERERERKNRNCGVAQSASLSTEWNVTVNSELLFEKVPK